LRLQAKYSLVIVSLIIMIVSVLAGAILVQSMSLHNDLMDASVDTMTKDLMDQMVKRCVGVTQLLAETLINPVYQHDMQAIFELLNAARQQPDILNITVYDTDGRIIHDGNEKIPTFGRILPDEKSIEALPVKGKVVQHIQRDTLGVSIPVWIGDTPLGGVKVVMSLKKIHSDIRSMEIRLNEISRSQMHRGVISIAITTLLMILIGILFSIIVVNRLIQPVHQLIRYTKQVGIGNYDFEVTLKSHDEIGDLVGAFRQMSQNLKSKENDLNKSREGLEQRVKERTAELEDATEGLKQEIAERRQTEEALRESEERYGAVVKQTSEGIYLLNPDTKKIIEANNYFCRMVGYTPEEISELDIYNFLDHDKSSVDANIKKAVSKKYYLVGERKYKRKDGSAIDIEARTNLISFAGKNVLCVLVRDITEHNRIQEEKARLEAQLQRAQKMEAIGELAGGVAHDLNNILSGLVSYPELILMDIPDDSPLRKPILTMQKSGQKAAVIVQDLLTLARRGVTATEIVNLNQIVSEYLKSPEYRKLILYHPDVRIEARLKTDLFNIKGSQVHLSKTIMNLVSNATEAIDDTGKIIISTANRYVDKPIGGYDDVEEGEYAVLKVIDTGMGIHPENIERIFEPFYTKKVMGRSGTGLGMAVVWGTVKDHNGYINVKSQPGKGSVFTLFFPATREDLFSAASVPIEKLMGHNETILVVDDVNDQREIASGMLKKLGYKVKTAPSGEKAIEYLKTGTADLLLLDMIMENGLDGLDTYRDILKLQSRQKAIIASGFSETKRVKEALALGVGQYIKKPYSMENLGLAVKTELAK